MLSFVCALHSQCLLSITSCLFRVLCVTLLKLTCRFLSASLQIMLFWWKGAVSLLGSSGKIRSQTTSLTSYAPPPKPMLTCLERYDTIVHSNTQFSQWALCRWKPDAWKGTSWNGAGLATLTLERHAPCSVPRWFVEGQKPPQCTGRYLLVLAEPKT